MAFFLAVANRKGGVGKSTISVMIAHAAAVWGRQRVLLLDLDSQCNASLILLGGQGWSEARKEGRTIADYFYDLFDGNDEEAVSAARARWKRAKDAGHTLAYWQQSESGGWVKKAEG